MISAQTVPPVAPRAVWVALGLLAVGGAFLAPIVVLPLLAAALVAVIARRRVRGRTRTALVLLAASLTCAVAWFVLQLTAVSVVGPRSSMLRSWDVAVKSLAVVAFALVVAALAVGARGLVDRVGQARVVWAAWGCAVVWLLTAVVLWAVWSRVLDLEDAGLDATGSVALMVPVLVIGSIALIGGGVLAIVIAVRAGSENG